MARVSFDAKGLAQIGRDRGLNALAQAGPVGLQVTQRWTPVKTGALLRSEYWALYDEGGAQIAGTPTDAMGVATPSGGAAGNPRLVIGANAPYGYWQNNGFRGVPGKHFLEAGLDAAGRVALTVLKSGS